MEDFSSTVIALFGVICTPYGLGALLLGMIIFVALYTRKGRDT